MQKEAERPVLTRSRAGQKPVFTSSSGRPRRLVRLTSRLLAAGMIALVTLVVATIVSPVHDSAPPWPVITIQAR